MHVICIVRVTKILCALMLFFKCECKGDKTAKRTGYVYIVSVAWLVNVCYDDCQGHSICEAWLVKVCCDDCQGQSISEAWLVKVCCDNCQGHSICEAWLVNVCCDDALNIS